jgi:ADP-ribose pyrophosphatase YjhB (NUDIX family)
MYYTSLHNATKNKRHCMKSNTQELSKSHPMPFTRIEIVCLSVVDDELLVLLAKRAEAPFAGKWALPGGVLRIDHDSTLDAGAKRVMAERLGVEGADVEQLCAVGGAKRDPRAPWALSVVYRVLVIPDALKVVPGKRIEALEWQPVVRAMADSLAFDHSELIARALEKTREQVEGMVLPLGLLPPEFTLTELQVACERVLGRPLDKSSFRRKLAERDLVESVPGAMRSGPFRPAQLFRSK